METTAFLNHLRASPAYRDQIAHIEPIPARPPRYAALEEPLEAGLRASLSRNGITSLYTHQAAAVNAQRRGDNVMVATSSASGKTLCYNLPVLEALRREAGSRALYLFPTKALAQDQRRTLGELSSPDLLRPGDIATFDGDTPRETRPEIRRRARIILSNPDMLHVGILPNHQSWSGLLHHLRYVVVDEAHVYRGVFGSHVAGVLRRLRRLCNYYGSAPQFICTSATIANPGEHAGELTGLPFTVVDDDGSPQGGKEFVFWNPPLVDEEKSTRGSTNSEATYLFTHLIRERIRTLTFTRTRRLTELIYVYARQNLAEISGTLAAQIKPYRAGYLPEQRREIERELFRGNLLGVVATNALELGVDIGSLEATVLSGYPGSIASTWQQAGRSGRRRGGSLSFLVAMDDPLDQYLMRHPDFFFGRNFEHALVNPGNPYILRAHLLCAAWERALSGADEALFGEGYREAVASLEAEGRLRERQHRWYPAPLVTYPAADVSIRAATGEHFAVIDTASGELLETIESSTAFFQVHPGAVYLHQGDPYLVTELDLVSHTAYTTPTEVNYYTQCRDFTDVRVVSTQQSKNMGAAKVYLGEVEVTTRVVGYKKKMQYTGEMIGDEPLDLPAQTFATKALWFDLPGPAMARIAQEGWDLAGGLHAAEHAAIGILPLFALCDRNDIGGVSTPLHPDTGRAQIFIYDAYPGGVGIAEKGFDLIRELWEATLRGIVECPCREGCPSCIQSPKCGNNNQPLDKQAAVALLRGLLAV